MNIETTAIPQLLVIRPRLFRDDRGLFLETWQQQQFLDAGIEATFVQDNSSRSGRGVLRGLHYQILQPQGKLIHVTHGKALDVIVDLRRSSPTFGQHAAFEIDDVEHTMLYVPPGCAHGFLALTDVVDLSYRCTDYYAPQHERTLLWNDPELGIEWPGDVELILSEKDRAGLSLAQAECFP